MEPQNHHYRFLIIIIFLILAVLISTLAFSRFTGNSAITGTMMTKVSEVPKPVKPTIGSMAIKSSDDINRHSLTDYLKLDVYIESAGADVVGYDTLVGFDSQAFQLIQAESTQADFSIFKTNTESGLTLTGSKKISATGQDILSNVKIVTLTFKPQKTGRFVFSLIGERGKEKTQFVDTMSKVYNPKLNEIQIEIY